MSLKDNFTAVKRSSKAPPGAAKKAAAPAKAPVAAPAAAAAEPAPASGGGIPKDVKGLTRAWYAHEKEIRELKKKLDAAGIARPFFVSSGNAPVQENVVFFTIKLLFIVC